MGLGVSKRLDEGGSRRQACSPPCVVEGQGKDSRCSVQEDHACDVRPQGAIVVCTVFPDRKAHGEEEARKRKKRGDSKGLVMARPSVNTGQPLPGYLVECGRELSDHSHALPKVYSCRCSERNGKEDRCPLVRGIEVETAWDWLSAYIAKAFKHHLALGRCLITRRDSRDAPIDIAE